MEIISFKQFIKDYEEYYSEKITTIRTEYDMEEVIWDIYDTDKYEFDFDKKIIELY